MLDTISKIIADYLPEVPFGLCSVKDIKKPSATRLEKNGLDTAIIFAFPYKVKEQGPKNISRYAAVNDYHDIILPKLKKLAEKLAEIYPQNRFRAFADYSPILEVPAAAKAELGFIGKNGLLITKDYGSFVFLGEILCDIPFLDTDNTAFCDGCNLCKTACPVGLNKDECLSALTQKKGELTEEERAKIKALGSCFGCDICQNACPKNKNAKTTFIAEFNNSYRDEFCPNEDENHRAYNWRGKAVPIRNFSILEEK